MRTINIQQAKTHLSRLVEEAARGESFVIAKAGRPIAKVVPLDAEPKREKKHLGFGTQPTKVPDDFDRMHEKRSKRCSTATREISARYAPSGLGASSSEQAVRHGAFASHRPTA